MVMAPLLGLASYFAFGVLFAEKPQPAEVGQTYKLVEKPDCRRSGGMCGMKNVDFELTLTVERLDNGRMLLKLKSEYPLDGVKLALVENAADEEQPVDMQATGSDGLNWVLEIKIPDPEHDRLHLATSSRQTFYFADVATKFTSIDTENQDSK